MTEQDCLDFLQWALPRMGFHWPGFRKVRGQVRKRIQRRLTELGLENLDDYRELLDAEDKEWWVLDGLCRITISRFHRDRVFFEQLARQVLPALAEGAAAGGGRELRMWSAGCGAGEEPYTLAMIVRLASAPCLGRVEPRIVATDTNAHQLSRAAEAVYPASTLAELPLHWRQAAFDPLGDGTYRLRRAFKAKVDLVEQDLRRESPAGDFHLVLCRNLAFTYFSEDIREGVLERLRDSLVSGGVLGVGLHESLPPAATSRGLVGFEPWPETRNLYRKL